MVEPKMFPFQYKTKRSAYTLIELMVVLAIVLGVMGLVVAFYPNYSQREDLYRSSDMLRNTLMRARAWAQRDKVTTGISFGSSSGNLGATLTFIQSPPIIYGTSDTATTAGSNPLTISFLSANPGSFSPPIGPGDFIFSESGQEALLINGAPTISGNTVSFPLGNSPTTSVQNFQIIRQASPMPAEPVIILSPSIFLDLTDIGSSQILFNGKGQCLTRNTGIINLRVIQTDNGSPIETNASPITSIRDKIDSKYNINEMTIRIDASTGVTKVLGR